MSLPHILKVQLFLVFLTSFSFVPIILGVLETPEYVYLPPYFGCFHSTLYSEVPEEFQGTHFYFNPFGVLPSECITFCLRNSTLGFEIAAIKGEICICAHITGINQNLQKVPKEYCDIQCRKKRGVDVDKGQVIVPNEHCGGNIPYSVYCAVPPNNQSSGPVNTNNFCKTLWIGSAVEKDVYLGDFTTYDNFETQCVVCLNDSVICPQRIFEHGRSQGKGQIGSNRTSVIGFEYSPKNSPLNCINYCRRLLGTRIDFVGILGRSKKLGGTAAGAGIDTCFCVRSTGINMGGFEIVESGNCSKRCPGDGSLNCPNDRLGDGPEYFVLYGIFTKDLNPVISSERPMVPCENGVILADCVAETTPTTIKTEKSGTAFTPSTVETTESTIETTESTIETTKSTIDTTESTNETTKSTIETTESTVDTTESTIETTESTIETTESTIETTESTSETTESTNETTESTIVTTESTIETTESTTETTESTIETTESTIETTESTVETPTSVETSTISTSPTILNSTLAPPSSMKTTTLSSSTKTTTPPKDCPIKCNFTEYYGHHWSACAGDYATKDCNGTYGGTGSWKCGLNGEFIGKPDYKNCTTPWIDKLKDEILKECELGFDKAELFLKLIEDKCTDASKSDPNAVYFGHEISIVMTLGVQVMDKLDPKQVSITMFEDLASKMTTIVGIVLNYPEVWDQLSEKEKCSTGTELLCGIEDSFFTLSTKVVEDQSLSVKDQQIYHYEPDTSNFPFNVETGVVLKSRTKGRTLRFPRTEGSSKESFIELPQDWADLTSGFPDDEDEVEFVGVQIGITNATNLFNPGGNDECDYEDSDEISCEPSTRIINSNMLSFSFGDKDNLTKTTFTGKGVQISFEHDVMAWGTAERPIRRKLHPGERQKAIQDSAACKFWDTDDQSWSSKGCKIVESSRTRTVCECNHLTAFALLMDIHNYEGKEFWLEVLTLILTPMSIICLFASLIIFIRFKEIQGPRTTITRNLCICLLIGMILVITVMDRNYIWLPDELCTMTAMLVHYIFLCVFSWMALEGLLLYRMVILVFDTQRHYMNYQRGGAYGIPLLIVGVTYLISVINDDQAYGGDEFCWLEDNYKWGFMGPVAIITVVNLIILVMTLKKAYNLQQSPKATTGLRRKKSIISWIRGTFGVTILLGGTWVFGFLMVIPNPTVSGIAACIFTILNASQGIFLFIFHCVLNKKVRDHMRGHFPAWTSISFSTMLRTDSNSSKFKFYKKSDALSISNESNNSKRNSPRNTGNVEQIGRRELVAEF